MDRARALSLIQQMHERRTVTNDAVVAWYNFYKAKLPKRQPERSEVDLIRTVALWMELTDKGGRPGFPYQYRSELKFPTIKPTEDAKLNKSSLIGLIGSIISIVGIVILFLNWIYGLALIIGGQLISYLGYRLDGGPTNPDLMKEGITLYEKEGRRVIEWVTNGISRNETEEPEKTVLLFDDDVYERPVQEFYNREFERAFGNKIKLAQFFSACDALDYLISNKVNLIISSSICSRGNRPYNDGGDIFIKACKTLFPHIPFVVYSALDNKDSFTKHGVPDVYIAKNDDLPLLFSTVTEWGNKNKSTEDVLRKIHFEDIDTLFGLGLAYFLIESTENYEKSLEVFKKVIRINPSKDSLHYYIGVNYYILAKNRDALEYLKIAVEEMPDFEEAHCALGDVYLSLEMYKEALESFENAIFLVQDCAFFYLRLGKAYEGLGMKKQAAEAFSRSICMEPEKISGYLGRGAIYFDLCEYKKAISDFGKAIELFEVRPNSLEAYEPYNSRGVCYSRLGDYKKAIADYNKSIELIPKYELSYYNRGIAYFECGDFEMAIDDYKKAIELSPDYKDAYNNLGLAYQTLGMYREAINTFKGVLTKFPDFEKAQKNLEETYVLERQDKEE